MAEPGDLYWPNVTHADWREPAARAPPIMPCGRLRSRPRMTRPPDGAEGAGTADAPPYQDVRVRPHRRNAHRPAAAAPTTPSNEEIAGAQMAHDTAAAAVRRPAGWSPRPKNGCSDSRPRRGPRPTPPGHPGPAGAGPGGPRPMTDAPGSDTRPVQPRPTRSTKRSSIVLIVFRSCFSGYRRGRDTSRSWLDHRRATRPIRRPERAPRRPARFRGRTLRWAWPIAASPEAAPQRSAGNRCASPRLDTHVGTPRGPRPLRRPRRLREGWRRHDRQERDPW